MTDATDLAAMLPEDPTGDAPWQRAARGVLAELSTAESILRKMLDDNGYFDAEIGIVDVRVSLTDEEQAYLAALNRPIPDGGA